MSRVEVKQIGNQNLVTLPVTDTGKAFESLQDFQSFLRAHSSASSVLITEGRNGEYNSVYEVKTFSGVTMKRYRILSVDIGNRKILTSMGFSNNPMNLNESFEISDQTCPFTGNNLFIWKYPRSANEENFFQKPRVQVVLWGLLGSTIFIAVLIGFIVTLISDDPIYPLLIVCVFIGLWTFRKVKQIKQIETINNGGIGDLIGARIVNYFSTHTVQQEEEIYGEEEYIPDAGLVSGIVTTEVDIGIPDAEVGIPEAEIVNIENSDLVKRF